MNPLLFRPGPIAASAYTHDFTSIGAGAAQDVNVSVPKAVVGDFVQVLSADPTNGIQLTGKVTANGTVRLRAINLTAASIDPTAISYKILLTRA